MKDHLKNVGIWGQRHYDHLKAAKPSVINVMRMNGNLSSYLQNVNDSADEMFCQLVKQLAKQEGVTEQLKQQDQTAWVGVMNSIRERATDIVMNEVILI